MSPFHVLLLGAALFATPAAKGAPVLVGLDLEFGHPSSTSAEAIRRGVALAVEEINAAGGVLGGRPLEVVQMDNRAVPARGVENVRALAARKDLVAVFAGKFSPVVQEEIPLLHELKLPLLDPWAAADDLIDHGRVPSYTFRLSLRDTWAMQMLLHTARARGIERVGLMLPNTGWGRSNAAAAAAMKPGPSIPDIVATRWFNWGIESLVEDYRSLRAAGAQAVILVTNEGPAAILVKEMAALPPGERIPLLAHHGVVGGDLVKMAGPALQQVDLSVVQFFTFAGEKRPRARALFDALQHRYGVPDVAHALSAAGTAAAYDLTYILARAIQKAGSTDRPAIRRALEEVTGYEGAVKSFPRPFTPTRHEALGPEDVFMARFDASGALVRSAR